MKTESMGAPVSYQEDPQIQKRRWLILVVLNLFTFMSTLDGSIVNIALPVISKQLDLQVAEAEWVVTAYLMMICAAILFSASWGTSSEKSKFSSGA